MNLFQAVEAENEVLIRSLIKDGVNVNERNKFGETPLHSLVAKKYTWQIIKFFPSFNKEEKDGNREITKEEYQRRAKVAEILIQAGADVNSRKEAGLETSILYSALKTNNEPLIDLLLKSGAHVNASVVENFIFCFFKEKSDINIVRNLLKYSCDINYYTYIVNIIFILNHDHSVELIKLLLEYGADLKVKNDDGFDVIERYLVDDFEENGVPFEFRRGLNSEILKVLPLNDYNMSQLHKACMFNEYNYVRELVKRRDIQIDAEDVLGLTPLYYAVVTIQGNSADEQESKVKLLLSLGADMSHVCKEYTIIDLCHALAVDCNRFEKISIFIQRESIVAHLEGNTKASLPQLVERNLRFEKEWLDCLGEVEMTKRYMLNDSISFFNLLVADSKKSVTYSKNKEIVSALEKCMSEGKFPIYQNWILHTNFGLALEHRKLLDAAAVRLCIILRFSDPSNEFFEKTLSYLSNQDLKLLLGLEGISVEKLIGYDNALDNL